MNRRISLLVIKLQPTITCLLLIFTTLCVVGQDDCKVGKIDLTRDNANNDSLFQSRNFCQEIGDSLMSNDIVCFVWEIRSGVPRRDVNTRIAINNCNLIIGDGQTLIIPAGLDIGLENDSNIRLTGDGKIIGDHPIRSTITNKNSGASGGHAVRLDANCDGCEVRHIGISGENNANTIDTNNIRGLVIEPNSTDNIIDDVHFENLDFGVQVCSDGNTLSDLSFFQVAIDPRNCDPEGSGDEGKGTAVHVEDASDNNITNVVHFRSPGAMTIWLQGDCDNNVFMNISEEQEDTHCKPADGFTDPSLHIENPELCENNYGIFNFNGGWIYPAPPPTDTLMWSPFYKRNTMFPFWEGLSSDIKSGCN